MENLERFKALMLIVISIAMTYFAYLEPAMILAAVFSSWCCGVKIGFHGGVHYVNETGAKGRG